MFLRFWVETQNHMIKYALLNMVYNEILWDSGLSGLNFISNPDSNYGIAALQRIHVSFALLNKHFESSQKLLS